MIKFIINGSCVHSDPVQTAFMIGTLDVHWYAITYLLGFLIAIIIGCIKLHFYYRISYEPFFWYAVMAIPGAIFGARAWSYIIGDAKFPPGTPVHVAFLEFFGVGSGGIAGLAILGGVMMDVIIALIWFPLILRRAKYSVRVVNELGLESVQRPSIWIYADTIVPLIVLGQAIGRWGNFTNHEVFGDITSGQNLDFLAFMIPGVFNNMFIIPEQYHHCLIPEVANFYQPFFLYESFADIMLWALIYFGLERFKSIKKGSLAAGYFIGYGIIRSAMELNRYGYSFVDMSNPPYGDNGYSLMKFGFDKDYITACLFVIFGTLSFVFVNLYAYKMRKYKVWSFIDQKIAYPFVIIFYKLRWKHFNKFITNKNKAKYSSSAVKIKLSDIDQKLAYYAHFKDTLSHYERTKNDLAYFYSDYDARLQRNENI